MDQAKCGEYVKVIMCEMLGLFVVFGVCIVWILGWTGCLGGLSEQLKTIQSYSGLINSIYGILNTVIVVVLGLRSKSKISKQIAREREQAGLMRQEVSATLLGVENMRQENDERLSLIQNEVVTTYNTVEKARVENKAGNELLHQDLSATKEAIVEGQSNLFENMRVIIAHHKELLEGNKRVIEALDSSVAPVHIRNINHNVRNCNYTFNMILVGSSFSGKTCLLEYWKSDKYRQGLGATLGVSICMKKINTDIGAAIFSVSDSAGNERFDEITCLHVRRTECVVVLIDITDKSSLGVALNWGKTCKEINPNAFIVYLCNKIDLADKAELDQHTIDEAIEGNPCFRVSAKTGENVHHALSLAALGAVIRASVKGLNIA